MAKTHRKSRQPNRPVIFFLRCFGFSRNRFSDGKTLQTNHTKKPCKRWFRWSTHRINKATARTVPVDHSAELITDTSKNSTKTRRSGQVMVPEISENQIRPASDPPNSITGKRVTSGRHVEPSKSETCHKRISFRRKVDAIQPGKPPQAKPKSARAQTHLSTRLSQSHTVSLQATSTTQGIRAVIPAAQFRVGSKEPVERVNGKYEPVLGMSILIVTLIITLFWGRLCAILCTSAWLYFFPRLRTLINDNDAVKDRGNSSSADLDLNSAEHKKRVVLEGFLYRNHNNRSLL